ncbi:MAG: hypothetical protein CSA33_06550 [Desulfobulbus propionicus]|nr:MAG: hypothetical protein CSA33_06550 [Desulfobulbus propionicus]
MPKPLWDDPSAVLAMTAIVFLSRAHCCLVSALLLNMHGFRGLLKKSIQQFRKTVKFESVLKEIIATTLHPYNLLKNLKPVFQQNLPPDFVEELNMS